MCQRAEDMDIQDRHLKVRTITRERNVWECLFWPSSMSTSFCRMSVIATFRECYKQNFGMYETNPHWLFLRIVAGDETWIHHWDPETRQKSTTINSWNDYGHSVLGIGMTEVRLRISCSKTTITDVAVLPDLKVVVSEGRIGKVTCMPCIFTAMLLYTNGEKQPLL